MLFAFSAAGIGPAMNCPSPSQHKPLFLRPKLPILFLQSTYIAAAVSTTLHTVVAYPWVDIAPLRMDNAVTDDGSAMVVQWHYWIWTRRRSHESGIAPGNKIKPVKYC